MKYQKGDEVVVHSSDTPRYKVGWFGSVVDVCPWGGVVEVIFEVDYVVRKIFVDVRDISPVEERKKEPDLLRIKSRVLQFERQTGRKPRPDELLSLIRELKMEAV